HNWAFHQLRMFVSYKARLYGVKVEDVDPRYTSQRCFVCGNIDKANRKTQAEFSCTVCGHTANADVNAALNIACWASVNAPIVSEVVAEQRRPNNAATVAPGTSQPL
ncbi:IS200/IS605 family element transposase accessory protein TnpB, partial [Anaerolineae bacterium CFX8]|nr:IS200/IS605 family element transposase accessory protein TnpB [Anaerolineae bacterium CFX8]